MSMDKVKQTKMSLYASIPLLLSILIGVSPRIALGAERTVRSFIMKIVTTLNYLIPTLIGLGMLLFFWGLADYIFQSGDESKVETGKQRMIWGIIGMFFVSAIWGIVELVGSSLFLF